MIHQTSPTQSPPSRPTPVKFTTLETVGKHLAQHDSGSRTLITLHGHAEQTNAVKQGCLPIRGTEWRKRTSSSCLFLCFVFFFKLHHTSPIHTVSLSLTNTHTDNDFKGLNKLCWLTRAHYNECRPECKILLWCN